MNQRKEAGELLERNLKERPWDIYMLAIKHMEFLPK